MKRHHNTKEAYIYQENIYISISLQIFSYSKSFSLVEAWNRQDYDIWYMVYYTIYFEFLRIQRPQSIKFAFDYMP